MAHIETRKGKRGTSYRVQIILKGHPRVSATFRRRSDAKAWATATEAAIRERRYFPSAEAERHTVGELVDRFIAEALQRRAARDRTRVANQLTWWKDRLGAGTRLADVTPALIVEARDGLANGDSPSGKSASPATVNRYLAALSKALSVAVEEWFWLEDNPCRRVPRVTEPRGRVRYLSEEERDRLLAACRNSEDTRLYPLVLLAVSTGARREELLGLRWQDIDFGRRMAIVHDTKNGDRRTLPLTGSALQVLRERAKVRRIDTRLVFAGSAGTASFPRKPWLKALERAGIEDFRFHDLRHTAASYLAMSGATLMELAAILGHRTLAMVKRYAHLTNAHTTTVVERMNRRFLGESTSTEVVAS